MSFISGRTLTEKSRNTGLERSVIEVAYGKVNIPSKTKALHNTFVLDVVGYSYMAGLGSAGKKNATQRKRKLLRTEEKTK